MAVAVGEGRQLGLRWGSGGSEVCRECEHRARTSGTYVHDRCLACALVRVFPCRSHRVAVRRGSPWWSGPPVARRRRVGVCFHGEGLAFPRLVCPATPRAQAQARHTHTHTPHPSPSRPCLHCASPLPSAPPRPAPCGLHRAAQLPADFPAATAWSVLLEVLDHSPVTATGAPPTFVCNGTLDLVPLLTTAAPGGTQPAPVALARRSGKSAGTLVTALTVPGPPPASPPKTVRVAAPPSTPAPPSGSARGRGASVAAPTPPAAPKGFQPFKGQLSLRLLRCAPPPRPRARALAPPSNSHTHTSHTLHTLARTHTHTHTHTGTHTHTYTHVHVVQTQTNACFPGSLSLPHARGYSLPPTKPARYLVVISSTGIAVAASAANLPPPPLVLNAAPLGCFCGCCRCSWRVDRCEGLPAAPLASPRKTASFVVMRAFQGDEPVPGEYTSPSGSGDNPVFPDDAVGAVACALAPMRRACARARVRSVVCGLLWCRGVAVSWRGVECGSTQARAVRGFRCGGAVPPFGRCVNVIAVSRAWCIVARRCAASS